MIRTALLLALALTACGRKDPPEAPPRPASEATPLARDQQDDDPLIEPLPPSVTPGPRVEEQVDRQLAE